MHFLIHDRDPPFTKGADVQSSRLPCANRRFVRSMQESFLKQLILFGRAVQDVMATMTASETTRVSWAIVLLNLSRTIAC
jgi:hypothetical protein